MAINASLMTLGRCLEALRWNQQHRAAEPKLVPYRESKVQFSCCLQAPVWNHPPLQHYTMFLISHTFYCPNPLPPSNPPPPPHHPGAPLPSCSTSPFCTSPPHTRPSIPCYTVCPHIIPPGPVSCAPPFMACPANTALCSLLKRLELDMQQDLASAFHLFTLPSREFTTTWSTVTWPTIT